MIIIAVTKDDEPVSVSTIINTGFDQNDKIVSCNSKTYAEQVSTEFGVFKFGACYVIVQRRQNITL